MPLERRVCGPLARYPVAQPALSCRGTDGPSRTGSGRPTPERRGGGDGTVRPRTRGVGSDPTFKKLKPTLGHWGTVSFPGDGDATHVVLITVDCLRADAAREMETLSVLMDSHVDVPDCQCTGSGTPTSMPGIMQSRLPTDHGGRASRHPLVPEVPTLAEALSDAGFACGGWHSNPNTTRVFEYQRGFDTFVDLGSDQPGRAVDEAPDSNDDDDDRSLVFRTGKAMAKGLGLENEARKVWRTLQRFGVVDVSLPYERAESVVDSLLDWFPESRTDEPHFAWGHLMDLHHPYAPPPEYRRRDPDCPVNDGEIKALNAGLSTPQHFSEAQTRQLRALYDAATRYVDDQIERLVEQLRARRLWDETVLVVTSDHGEMFDDRPIPDDYAFKHPNYLCDYVTHVPLVFAGGGLPDERIGGVASGMDVAPTIGTLVGAGVPAEWNGDVIGGPEYAERAYVHSVSGRGVRGDHSPGEIQSNVLHASLRTAEETVLWWSGSAHGPEFYDREATHDDPTVHETAVDPDAVPNGDAYVEAVAERFGEAAARRRSRSESPEPDEEIADRLRQLGYIE